jgi:hypothetical protein
MSPREEGTGKYGCGELHYLGGVGLNPPNPLFKTRPSELLCPPYCSRLCLQRILQLLLR